MTLLNHRKTLGIVGALAVAGIVGYLAVTRKPAAPKAGSPEQDSADVATLASSKSTWAEQSQAMMRLSIKQSPEALKFIQNTLATPSSNTSPWATRALGYFTVPEAIRLLEQQLRSDSPQVREAAFDALGMRAHPEKSNLLRTADSFAKSDSERARLILARVRLAADPTEKSRQAVRVLQELQRKDLDPNARNLLVSQIFFLSPRTSEVEKYYAELVRQLKKGDESSGLAVIRGLKLYCPNNRFALLQEFLGRSGLSVSAKAQALNELIFHAGPEADALFAAGTKDPSIPPAFLENLKKQRQTSKIQSPCDTRKAT